MNSLYPMGIPLMDENYLFIETGILGRRDGKIFSMG